MWAPEISGCLFPAQFDVSMRRHGAMLEHICIVDRKIVTVFRLNDTGIILATTL